MIGFPVLALVTGVWLFFDENVVKPIERLATDLPACAHADITANLDADQLGDTAMLTAGAVAAETARLEAIKPVSPRFCQKSRSQPSWSAGITGSSFTTHKPPNFSAIPPLCA